MVNAPDPIVPPIHPFPDLPDEPLPTPMPGDPPPADVVWPEPAVPDPVPEV
jgi:hypothetical protein